MDSKNDVFRDESLDSESVDEEYDGLISRGRRAAVAKKFTNIARLFPYLLCVSVILNIFQSVYISVRPPKCVSLYAKLPEHEINIPLKYSTEYGSLNTDEDAKNKLWDSIDISEGLVALTHQESDSLGLPRSKTFPWDINKGVYLSHAHHSLHCVTLIRAHTHDAHHGKIPMVTYHHVEHCLDLLRQDVMCYADDFMDFDGEHGTNSLTGDNQPRQCRDWSKLSKWVQDRTACYKSVNITRSGEDHGVSHELERYSHCPEGSPYLPMINAWRELNRSNGGNIEEDAIEAQTEEDAAADAEDVAEHNSAIMSDE